MPSSGIRNVWDEVIDEWAVAKRIAGEHRRPGLEKEERDEILTELQQVRQEVAELAERMDFAERLLAKPRG